MLIAKTLSALVAGAFVGTLVALVPQAARAQSNTEPPSDLDALSLTPDKAEPVPANSGSGFKLYVEGAAGAARQQSPSRTRTLSRATVDFFDAVRITPDIRGVISDRLDVVHPTDTGADSAVNTLREAYLGWQAEGGATALEFGRINMRYGPSYGYNPTDFFRDASLRVVTTADPLALRERRQGTVALRGQQLWNGGSLSIALSPKLANRPSSPNTDGASLDLGGTNNRDRGLVVLSTQFSERLSTQLLLGKESGQRAQVGASLTALATDAVTVHAEWTNARERPLSDLVLGLPGAESTRNRFSGGATFTTSTKLSVTAEYEYNGFGLGRGQSDALRRAPAQALGAYLQATLLRQEPASRQAYFLYATQQDAGITNLNLTALLRYDAVDHSRLAWVEARYHWPVFDLALQLQQQNGDRTTEYGSIPYRRSALLLATYYFR